MKRFIALMIPVLLFIFSACNDVNNHKGLSRKGKLLSSVTWKYDSNASIRGDENINEDSEGFVLKDDVKKIGDFFTGTLRFGEDKTDPEKLSYERKYGKGFFSVSVQGWWEFNDNETAIIMKEWDDINKKELPSETKQIIKLTKDRLILKDKQGIEHFYIAQ